MYYVYDLKVTIMIGLHDADLIYRNENVHESEKWPIT